MNIEEKKHRAKFFEKTGEFLRLKRVESGFGLREIAEKVGCKAQFICNIERGKAFPPPPVMRGMVEHYKINQKEFMEFLIEAQRDFYQDLYFTKKRRKRKKANSPKRLPISYKKYRTTLLQSLAPGLN